MTKHWPQKTLQSLQNMLLPLTTLCCRNTPFTKRDKPRAGHFSGTWVHCDLLLGAAASIPSSAQDICYAQCCVCVRFKFCWQDHHNFRDDAAFWAHCEFCNTVDVSVPFMAPLPSPNETVDWIYAVDCNAACKITSSFTSYKNRCAVSYTAQDAGWHLFWLQEKQKHYLYHLQPFMCDIYVWLSTAYNPSL